MNHTTSVLPPYRACPHARSIIAAAIAIISYLIPHLSSLHAAVPLRWTVETSRVQPAVFDVVHGESIELEAAMQSYGKPLSMADKQVSIFWQTNGMDAAWWSAPAFVRTGRDPTPGAATPTNVLAATFTPSMDPGAATVTGFLGATGDIYRAAFTIRFRKGPGAVPNALPLPTPTIDCAQVTFLHPESAPFGGENSITNVFTNGVSIVTDKVARIAIPDVSRKRDVSDMYSPLLGGGDFGIRGFVVGNEPVESGQEVDVDTEYDGKVGTETRWRFKYHVPYRIGVAYADDGSWEVSAYIREETLDVVGITETKHPFQRIRFDSEQGPFDQDIWIVFDRIATVNGVSAITNGLCTVEEAQGMANAAEANAKADAAAKMDTRLPARYDEGTYLIDHSVEFESSCWFARNVNLNFGSIIDDTLGGVSLLSYLTSLAWHPSNATLANYGITNAYTRAASDARYAPTGTAVTVASHTSQLSQLSQSVASKADAATVAQLNVQVQALGANANAEDARVIVTNYNSATRMPEARFDVKVSNSWITVWHEMTRWNGFLGGFAAYTNGVASTLALKGEREWGWFDSATGCPSPDGILQLAQPRIQICSGAAYQRYASAAGSAWVLESNGLVADINGTTNGYFRISDEEGNAHFEIVKGGRQSIFAKAKTMTNAVMGVTHYFTTYAVTNAVSAPVAEFSRSLSEPDWIRESEAGHPCNVSWTDNGDNSWTVEWWPIGNEPVLFMRAGYERGGETYIRNVAPVSMQHIYLGSTKYRLGTATIDGHTVLTLTAQ